MAWVTSTLGAQPEIVPSSVAKMNRLGPETLPFVTTKSFELLKTMPVGAPGDPPGPGMATTNDWGSPLPSYSVALPVPLSATHATPLGLNTTPHPFFRFGSTCGAGT